MNRAGFEKSRERLAEAIKALERLEASKNWNDFAVAWELLIWNLGRVYSALEQSVKGHPKSEKWFATQKRLRKTDGALQYLHQARNAAEHGIREVLEVKPAGISVGHPSGSMFIKMARGGPEGVRELIAWGPDGSPPQVKFSAERIELTRVFNRDRWYSPPEEFLGEKLENRTPVGLAAKVLEHMTVLFVDAQDLLV